MCPDLGAGEGSAGPEGLRTLASALRAGRVRPPFSSLTLKSYLGELGADAAVQSLAHLGEDGLSPAHLATFVDLLAAERERARAVAGGAVELVTTGPDAGGRPARETLVVVRELFRTAEQSVIVVGFAVHQGRDVFAALATRMGERPLLRVTLFLDVQRGRGDTSAPAELLRRFAHRFRHEEWPGERMPEVWYDPRSLEPPGPTRASLHAKCIVVDERVAFVSSANLTEAAQRRNIEVGVLVRSDSFSRQLASHFLTLADRQVLDRLPVI